jgi:hypothetical protein
VRNWKWWERALGALFGAIAGVMWCAILLPDRESKQTALSGSRQAHRKGGAKGGHPHRRRPVASYLDRVFPISYP